MIDSANDLVDDWEFILSYELLPLRKGWLDIEYELAAYLCYKEFL